MACNKTVLQLSHSIYSLIINDILLLREMSDTTVMSGSVNNQRLEYRYLDTNVCIKIDEFFDLIVALMSFWLFVTGWIMSMQVNISSIMFSTRALNVSKAS